MADVGTDMDSPIVHPRSAHAYLLPILSFFAIVILIVPFKWHWRLKNIGACSLAFYLSLSNLFTLINAIIWPTDNYDQWWDGAGLCDIEAKLRWPLITGIACSTLCICRNLANVLDVERSEISSTRASKKRKMIIDILLCYGIPVLQILLHYIIQYNRYIIGVLAGCLPTYDESWPTIVIMYMWPPIFCIANAYYCVAAIYRLRKYRSQFNRIISNSSSSSTLTASRFFRLFFMSVTIILFYAPVNIYFFYENVNITWFSYDWDIIHDPEHWNTIVYLPALGYRTFDRYCDIFMSFFVFVFFGLGGDAVDVYRKWMLKVGLGRVFPSLKHELKPNRSGSWTSKFSVISRAKSYFDKNQSTNSHTGLTSGLDNPSSSMARKPSFMTVEETSLSTYPSASAMRRHPTPILPDPYAISPMDPLEETATTSPLHQPHPSNPSYPFPATHVSTTKGNHNPQSWLDKVRHPFAKGNGSGSRHVQLGEGEGRDSFPPAPGQTLETHIWAGGEREPIGGVARKETSVAVDVEAGRGSL